MDKKAHVEVYKLRTIERCETSPQIKLMSMNNSKNMYEYLANIDGTYQSFLGFPQEEHLREIVAFYPNMPTDQKGSRYICLLYTSPSPRDRQKSRMPSSA